MSNRGSNPNMDADQRNYASNYAVYDETTFAVVNQPSSSSHTIQTWTNRCYPRELQILNDLTTNVVKDVASCCACVDDIMYEISYQGTKIFTVRENTDCCTHCCYGYGSRRPFTYTLYDLHENGIMSVIRTSVDYVQVKIAGRIIGSVESAWTLCRPKLWVRNATGEIILKIKRVMCLPQCFWSEIDFFVYNMDDEEVGKITRHWSGTCEQICASADTFSIKFPRDADIFTKALLIGACFCIDFRGFEPQSNGNLYVN